MKIQSAVVKRDCVVIQMHIQVYFSTKLLGYKEINKYTV